jgi:hypothetical protein
LLCLLSTNLPKVLLKSGTDLHVFDKGVIGLFILLITENLLLFRDNFFFVPFKLNEFKNFDDIGTVLEKLLFLS